MGFFADLFRFPGRITFIIVFVVTAVEDLGLVQWLNAARGGGSAPYNLGPYFLAPVILFVPLLSEHVISQVDHKQSLSRNDHRERFLSPGEVGRLAGYTFIEVIVWAIWLLLIPFNPAVAFVVFFISLFLEHQITNNVKYYGDPNLYRSFFHISSPRSKVFWGLVVETIFETVGASIWLVLLDFSGLISLLAVYALIAGSLVEHYVSTNVGRFPQ